MELEFSSSITGFPSRVNPGEEYRDGEEPIPGSLSSISSNPRYRGERERERREERERDLTVVYVELLKSFQNI